MNQEEVKKKAKLLAAELAEVLNREKPTNVAVVSTALSLVMSAYIRVVEEEHGQGKELANFFHGFIHDIINEL